MMDELYRFHEYSSFDTTHLVGASSSSGIGIVTHHDPTGLEMSDLIKAQIANHPLYPNLLSAYIQCRKVGAPPEMASVLEEISKENNPISATTEIGADPELDDFMKSYCEALHKYKEELSKPFDEATNFLSSIQTQLTDLCKQTLPTPNYHSAAPTATVVLVPTIRPPDLEGILSINDDEAHFGGCGSDEDDDMMSCGEVEGCGRVEVKEMLRRKYSGYLSSLRKEFLKKRKKGKLPKDAICALLEWWNAHYRWPYPTEEEKNRLSEMTGLDQKQINNWFINQRKRHWRPSDDMRFALIEGVTAGSMYFDAGIIDT